MLGETLSQVFLNFNNIIKMWNTIRNDDDENLSTKTSLIYWKVPKRDIYDL